MENIDTNHVTPPDEEQVARVLGLFKRITDPFKRGKVLGKLEAYVEQADAHSDNTQKSA